MGKKSGETTNEPPQDDSIAWIRPVPASGSPDEGSVAQPGLERSPVKAEVAGSNPAGAATIEELMGRLERLRTHQADYEEIEETAAKTQEALRRLVEERDEWKGAHDDVRQFHDACIKELYRILNVDGSDGEFRFKWAALEVSALRSSLTQHKDWLREALGAWKHWMTIPFSQRRVVDAFNDQERIAQIRKLMEGE